MSHTDALNDFLREVEEYLACHGDRKAEQLRIEARGWRVSPPSTSERIPSKVAPNLTYSAAVSEKDREGFEAWLAQEKAAQSETPRGDTAKEWLFPDPAAPEAEWSRGSFDIEGYIAALPWSDQASAQEKTLVAANLRALFSTLRKLHNAAVREAGRIERELAALRSNGGRDDLLESIVYAEEVLRTVPAYNGMRLFDLFPGLARAVKRRTSQEEKDA